MPVYVDRMQASYGRMIMCHMIADTPGELHAMADRIGVARRWFQQPPKASFWHYDIAKGKRELAVEAGALDCDRNTFVAALRRIRASASSRLAKVPGRSYQVHEVLIRAASNAHVVHCSTSERHRRGLRANRVQRKASELYRHDRGWEVGGDLRQRRSGQGRHGKAMVH